MPLPLQALASLGNEIALGHALDSTSPDHLCPNVSPHFCGSNPYPRVASPTGRLFIIIVVLLSVGVKAFYQNLS